MVAVGIAVAVGGNVAGATVTGAVVGTAAGVDAGPAHATRKSKVRLAIRPRREANIRVFLG